MINLLTIGTDRKLFDKTSLVRGRIIEQGKLFGELHVIVFANKSFGFRNEKISDNVWIYPTNSFNRWFYIFDAVRLGRRIVPKPYTLIAKRWVLSSQDPFECGLVVKRLAKLFGIKFQIQIHTDFLSLYFRKQSLLNRLRILIARGVLLYASGIRVVSKRIADSLYANRYTLTAIPAILPVYTDLNKIANDQSSDNLHVRFPDADFIILMASRLSPEKDIGTALQVIELIKVKYPKIKLIIVGEGLERERLVKTVKNLNLSGNVVFLPWQDNLAPFYKSADMFLLTSRYEGFGLTLVESAVAKCPIVSTDVGISRELLTGEFEKFICPVGDFIKIGERIVELVDSPELRKRLADSVCTKAVQIIPKDKNDYNYKYFKLIESCLIKAR